MIFDGMQLIHQFDVQLFIKIIILIVIGLYAIFSLMLANKIRSFNKILFLPPNSGGSLMQRIIPTYSIAVLVLFLLAFIVI